MYFKPPFISFKLSIAYKNKLIKERIFLNIPYIKIILIYFHKNFPENFLSAKGIFENSRLARK